jgi:hypothetical protein
MPDNPCARSLARITPIDGAAAVFPAGYPLPRASFHRHGAHLLVRADGQPDVYVPWFFGAGAPTTLLALDGAEMSRHMVLLKLAMSGRMERVLHELAAPGGRDG